MNWQKREGDLGARVVLYVSATVAALGSVATSGCMYSSGEGFVASVRAVEGIFKHSPNDQKADMLKFIAGDKPYLVVLSVYSSKDQPPWNATLTKLLQDVPNVAVCDLHGYRACEVYRMTQGKEPKTVYTVAINNGKSAEEVASEIEKIAREGKSREKNQRER